MKIKTKNVKNGVMYCKLGITERFNLILKSPAKTPKREVRLE